MQPYVDDKAAQLKLMIAEGMATLFEIQVQQSTNLSFDMNLATSVVRSFVGSLNPPLAVATLSRNLKLLRATNASRSELSLILSDISGADIESFVTGNAHSDIQGLMLW